MNHSKRANTVTRGVRLIVIVALLALLTGLLAVTQPARADTYEVTTSIDNSMTGSLRWAINQANGNSGADTITFAASTNGNPIILGGTNGEDVNTTGDLDILGGGGDLTIQGNGAANTIIDGGGPDRVFHVCPGGPCAITVTFSGVTIRNGNEGYGGGIYIAAGTTIVDSSAVSANASTYGGGIYNMSTLNVQNGSIIGGAGGGNQCLVGYGGGIYNASGTTTVDDSTVSANKAFHGGGIYNAAGTMTVVGSDVSGNATTLSGNGGGIYVNSGTMTVDDSTVSSNTADNYGGGIYNKGTLNVQNGSIIGEDTASNSAVQGGGIYNQTGGTTTVDGSSVSANTADYGGGIFNNATLKIQNGSTIGGVGAGNVASPGGGGIYTTGTMTVDGSLVSGNTATNHGGGVLNSGTLTLTLSTVSINKAIYGGGIFNSTGTTTVDGSTVSANKADYGGGINNTATLIVQNGSTIGGAGAGNEADYGGGIHNYVDGTTTVTGSRILNNTAATEGGGVYNHRDVAGATNVTGSCIVGNSEKSFVNDKSAEQIATGNWWGAAGGPNTSGADTVDGNVDVDDHLTAPILGCGPELQVSKSNDTGGNGVVGVTFKWTLTISSTGVFSATFPAGETILVDDLPAGAAYGTPVAGSFVDVDNQEEILCSLDDNTITCGADSADVILGANTGSFKVTIPVTPDAPATLTNPKAGGICEVDPDGNVPENDEGNNDCPENVVNVLGPELQVSKANDTDGDGVVGTPFTWTLTISNTGPSSATFDDLQTILKDDLPAGPAYGDPETGSFVDVTNGDKILCSVATNTNTLTCKASGGKVTLGPLTGSFEVTLLVTPDVPATLVNPVNPDGICQVDPDGNVPENDENNNDCPENTVTILDYPDLQVGKGNDTDGNGEVAKPFNWTLTISNTGPSSATFADLQTILKDDLPAGPAYGDPVAGNSANVTNSDKIKCSLEDDTLTCKAAGGDVTFGGVDSFFDVTFSVTPDAPVPLVNPDTDGVCQVDPDGKVTESDDSNNDCPANTVDVSVSTNYLYLPVVLK